MSFRMQGQCHSIKSRKESTVQCTHVATRGNFCGRHATSAQLFVPVVVRLPTPDEAPVVFVHNVVEPQTSTVATVATVATSSKTTTCSSARSKANPHEACPNRAKTQGYCMVHVRHPVTLRPHNDTVVQAKQQIQKPTQIPLTPTTMKKHTNAAAIISKWWKCVENRIHIGKWRLQGPATFARDLMSNEDDVYTCDTRDEISASYIFSFRDRDGFVYGFDARSLFQLQFVNGNKPLENPYTRSVLPPSVVRRLGRLRESLIMRKLPIQHAAVSGLTTEQTIRFKVVDMCQAMDELDFYTNPDWVLDLTVRQIHRFYHTLIDIFFRRAGLSHAQQREIIPCTQETNPFRMILQEFMACKSRTVLQNYIVQAVLKIVTSAVDRNNRKLASMYVLMALASVSPGCAQSYGFLIQ